MTEEKITLRHYFRKNHMEFTANSKIDNIVEVLCAHSTPSNTIAEIQKALKKERYNADPIDGIMGVKTQFVLQIFQEDNNLPLGSLNIETLKRLGVDY